MLKKPIHQCQCQICQPEKSHRTKELHSQMNLLLSRLDEQQRRWYVAIEVKNRALINQKIKADFLLYGAKVVL